MQFGIEIDVRYVEEQEDTLEDLDYVGCVLEKKHYRVKFLELKKFLGNL